MRRLALLSGTIAVLICGLARVQAQYPYPTARNGGYKHSHHIADQWMRNNMWPAPFMMQDRQAVRAPFAIMVDKGWQLQNTLGDHHFDVESQQLTRAGELHLKWIMTQAPESRRTVFVLRGHNEAATTVRVDTVQQAVAAIQPRGALPSVVQTNVAPPASAAERSNDINERAIKTRPDPILPARTGGSGGEGAGASGT